MIGIRIRGGTLRDKRLCDTCRYAHIMKDSQGSERIICSTNGDRPIVITEKVVDCNEFMDRKTQTRWELEKVGWVLQIKGKTILGFKPPSKSDE